MYKVGCVEQNGEVVSVCSGNELSWVIKVCSVTGMQLLIQADDN